MKAYVKITIGFILGALFGFGVALGIGWLGIKEGPVPLVGSKLYGDIVIAPLRPTQKDISGKELYQSLLLLRDDEKFIRINQNKLGNTRELLIYNNKSQAVAYVDFTDGKEPDFKYGLSLLECKYPYQRFIDFDMDGNIDYMIHFADKGIIDFEYAYFKETQEWEPISESEKGKRTIKIEDKTYKFIPSEGWVEETREDSDRHL